MAFGVIYTPFIPGGSELERALSEARNALPDSIRVFDASSDALTVLDLIRDVDILFIVGASPRLPEASYKRLEVKAAKQLDPHSIVDEIRASMEGSLDPLDLANALIALLSAEKREVRIIVYACGRGACREALKHAIDEARRLTTR